ncbi:hypothetical protein PUN28_014330 [Cardiocondyla obscurior]|uniref:Secreted protein n=1 Tax=Cardiocondyla obscurior TaxID=286306 RepID=A0AAW2F211_9HYME
MPRPIRWMMISIVVNYTRRSSATSNDSRPRLVRFASCETDTHDVSLSFFFFFLSLFAQTLCQSRLIALASLKPPPVISRYFLTFELSELSSVTVVNNVLGKYFRNSVERFRYSDDCVKGGGGKTERKRVCFGA